jgi:hypothetical protein
MPVFEEASMNSRAAYEAFTEAVVCIMHGERSTPTPANYSEV